MNHDLTAHSPEKRVINILPYRHGGEIFVLSCLSDALVQVSDTITWEARAGIVTARVIESEVWQDETRDTYVCLVKVLSIYS
jgi:hypothetical protein